MSIIEMIGEDRRVDPALLGSLRRAGTATRDGALSDRDTGLIGLGIAVAVGDGSGILAHLRAAQHAGASRDELLEAFGVAIQLGGGLALTADDDIVYALAALALAGEFRQRTG